MKKGFTLVELLLVIAIIGILASVVFLTLGEARPAARDSRRAADLKSVQNALEVYYARNNSYPSGTYTTRSGWDTTFVGFFSAIGVGKVPNDPLSTRTYRYCADATNQRYALATELENANSSLLNSSTANTPCPLGITCASGPGTNPYYCVSL